MLKHEYPNLSEYVQVTFDSKTRRACNPLFCVIIIPSLPCCFGKQKDKARAETKEQGKRQIPPRFLCSQPLSSSSSDQSTQDGNSPQSEYEKFSFVSATHFLSPIFISFTELRERERGRETYSAIQGLKTESERKRQPDLKKRSKKKRKKETGERGLPGFRRLKGTRSEPWRGSESGISTALRKEMPTMRKQKRKAVTKRLSGEMRMCMREEEELARVGNAHAHAGGGGVGKSREEEQNRFLVRAVGFSLSSYSILSAGGVACVFLFVIYSGGSREPRIAGKCPSRVRVGDQPATPPANPAQQSGARSLSELQRLPSWSVPVGRRRGAHPDMADSDLNASATHTGGVPEFGNTVGFG
ncbi:hypothetical protein ACLOJK_011040 [Asimina triloba]